MSKPAVSIFCFGIYLILLGLALILIPNFLLSIFTLPDVTDVWIRVAGMILFLLGYIYIRAGLDEEGLTKFFRWTVHTRATVIIFLFVFVLFGLVKPIIVLFGVVDLAAAIWTAVTLEK